MTRKLELISIPLDKLGVGENIRKHNIEMELDDLAINIKSRGQLQAILVYKKSDGSDEYEVLEGQRRLNAFDILNQKYPEDGYGEIQALLTDDPGSTDQKKSISLGANICQLSMTVDDIQLAVLDLWNKVSNMKLVAEQYGISEKTARKYVKGARLNDRLLNAVNGGEIDDDPEVSLDMVMEAVDLFNWTEKNDVSDDKVIEAAKTFAKKTHADKAEIIDQWQKDPEQELEEVIGIIKDNPEERKPKAVRLVLPPESDVRLDAYSKSRNKKRAEAASEILVDQLKKLVSSDDE